MLEIIYYCKIQWLSSVHVLVKYSITVYLKLFAIVVNELNAGMYITSCKS